MYILEIFEGISILIVCTEFLSVHIFLPIGFITHINLKSRACISLFKVPEIYELAEYC